MADTTSISWTSHTHNPWIGCTKVSPGCDSCYAESLNHRWGHDNWGKGKPRRLTSDDNWKKPLKWDREARASVRIDKVFCGSLCDVMDDEAPEGARERLWKLIDQTPNLFWQLLTKRPHRYASTLPSNFRHRNVILGATMEDQHYYDIRWPILRDAGRAYGLQTFVSYEPAIGPLSMTKGGPKAPSDFPDWLIFGGETGPHPRPMEQQWAENIKAECEANGVSFFMKQFSARTPDKAASLIPAHLLLRQFPAVPQ